MPRRSSAGEDGSFRVIGDDRQEADGDLDLCFEGEAPDGEQAPAQAVLDSGSEIRDADAAVSADAKHYDGSYPKGVVSGQLLWDELSCPRYPQPFT